MKRTNHLYRNLASWSEKGADKKRFVSLYGVFRENRENSNIEGYVEESLSMSWNEARVRMWSLCDAKYIFRKAALNHKKYKYFIYRLTRRDSFIVAEFSSRIRRFIEEGTLKNYYFRNVSFYTVFNKRRCKRKD